MPVPGRLAHYFLLICVVLSLGDAPYVDEFINDARQASTPAAASIDEHGNAPAAPRSVAHASGTCQLLLNLPGVTTELHLAVTDGVRIFPARTAIAFTSTPPDRIERPPSA